MKHIVRHYNGFFEAVVDGLRGDLTDITGDREFGWLLVGGDYVFDPEHGHADVTGEELTGGNYQRGLLLGASVVADGRELILKCDPLSAEVVSDDETPLASHGAVLYHKTGDNDNTLLPVVFVDWSIAPGWPGRKISEIKLTMPVKADSAGIFGLELKDQDVPGGEVKFYSGLPKAMLEGDAGDLADTEANRSYEVLLVDDSYVFGRSDTHTEITAAELTDGDYKRGVAASAGINDDDPLNLKLFIPEENFSISDSGDQNYSGAIWVLKTGSDDNTIIPIACHKFAAPVESENYEFPEIRVNSGDSETYLVEFNLIDYNVEI